MASFDVAIVNPELYDAATLKRLSRTSDLPKIITSASGSHREKPAVQTGQTGVAAYITKDPDGTYLAALPVTIEQAITRRTI